MPVRYVTSTQKLKMRMRNVCWVGVYCKFCKNNLHESWYAKNQSCIFLSHHTAAILGFWEQKHTVFPATVSTAS